MSEPKVRPTCCKQCPFARATPKTYLDTKGRNGPRFAGQAIGPFQLPCHMDREFDQWREKFASGEDTILCAGAAKFRANIGIAERLPEELGRAEPDHDAVFSSLGELMAHHDGLPPEMGNLILAAHGGPATLLAIELSKAGVQTRKLK